ncbi:MAG: hypothetical protein M1818_000763 [Claussenomyces sp. TS43310]|nr:MAG: hypothetical protein M1818_000763 [Claussenomyces sp. TS43310]
MSAPMIAWMPIVNRLYRYMTNANSLSLQPIHIPSVTIHDVETAAEHRPRTLKHLLKANHANYAVFFNHLRFHNHMPHILGSAYLMGATPDQLHHIYDEESKQLVPWEDSPAEIAKSDWKDFLGDKRYQRAYVDFFEDQLALEHAYRWRMVADEFLFEGKTPLINCVISGLGHPLIHLGYAYEFSSREVGMEALAATASSYNYLHKYLDNKEYTRAGTFSSTSPLEILHKIAQDDRFDGIFKQPAGDNFEILLKDHEDLILEYWNAWVLKDPVKQFQESQEAAVALLVATVQPGTHAYDFFLVHILTTSHAVRILLPMVPEKFHLNLVRQWWLLTVGVYIAQLRPKIEDDLIGRPDMSGKHWNYVEDKAVNSPWATDAHYVKGLRAIKEAAMTWGDVHEWYLTAAVRFADDFRGWTGFGPHDVN